MLYLHDTFYETMIEYLKNNFYWGRKDLAFGTVLFNGRVIKCLNKFKYKTWKSLDHRWCQLYDNYLKELNLSATTINSYHGKTRSFFDLAVRDGLIRSNPYNHFRIKPATPQKTIYLLEKDIEKIENIKLPTTFRSNYEVVRDGFIISCYTALRISDLSHISEENIITSQKKNGKEVRLLRIRTKKTGALVIIPLHPKVDAILNKYDMDFRLKPLSSSNNYTIKIIAKMAGLTEPVTITKTRGGNFTTTQVPKWKLIHFHTGRRTAITNMYMAGIPKIAIMKLAGHVSDETFMRYLRITEEENALSIIDHEYFKQRK